MKVLDKMRGTFLGNSGREEESIFDADWREGTRHAAKSPYEEYSQIAEKVYAATKVDAGTTEKPSEWLVEVMGGGKTKSGLSVNELNSLTCTTVFKCVRILSETIASLPLVTYERLPQGGKRRATNHPLWSILHDQVNPLMTSFEWRETLVGHLALWGNGYSEIQRDGRARIKALWPLRPDRMQVTGDGDRLRYIYTPPDGKDVEIPSENMLHVKGLSAGGYLGQSVISFARESISLALAYEEFGERFFSNDATPGGVLEHPGKLKPEAKDNIRKSWEALHSGLGNARRMAVLEEGMKYHQIGMPLEDAQFLEGRKYQERDIAGIFRIPSNMINDNEKSATYASVEQFAIQFVVHTIRPWCVRWEQAIKRDLFLPSEREKYFTEFLIDGLLRGDMKSRAEALAIMRQWGIINADDWNEIENRNPLPDGQGKVYIVPTNYQTTEAMIAAPAGEPAPAARLNGGLRVNINKTGPDGVTLNGGAHD